MTKAEIVNTIANATNIDGKVVAQITESFIEVVKDSLKNNKSIYLRGFGSFEIKRRSEKKARNISKNTTIIVPAHNIPVFKPSEKFVERIKK